MALYCVQGINYVLPLVVLPYLLRILGPAQYGVIVFSQSLIRYGVILTDFGFTLSATRAVSLARDQPDALARIFWSTFAAKSVLLLLSAVVVAVAAYFTTELRADWHIVAACSLLLFGSTTFPEWYFLGLERMRVVALIYFATGMLTLVAVFLFVKTSTDELAAAVILSSQQMVAALISIAVIPFLVPVRPYFPRPRDVVAAIRSSWNIFLSIAAGSLYLNTNTFLLGIISGRYAVALYALANKLALAMYNILVPVVRAAYPRVSLLFGESLDRAFGFTRALLRWLVPAALCIAATTFLFANEIIRLLAGRKFAAAVPVLQILSILPAILVFSSIVSQVVMVNLGLDRSLSRIYMLVGAFNLALVPALVHKYGASGAAVSVVIAECLGPILMVLVLRKAGVLNRLIPCARVEGR